MSQEIKNKVYKYKAFDVAPMDPREERWASYLHERLYGEKKKVNLIKADSFFETQKSINAVYNTTLSQRKILCRIIRDWSRQLKYEKNKNNGIVANIDDLSKKLRLSYTPKDILKSGFKQHNHIKRSLKDILKCNVAYRIDDLKTNECKEIFMNIFSKVVFNTSFTDIENVPILKTIDFYLNIDFVKTILLFETQIKDGGVAQAVRYTELDYNVMQSLFDKLANIKLYEIVSGFVKMTKNGINIKRKIIPYYKQNLITLMIDPKHRNESNYYAFKRHDLFIRHILNPAIQSLKEKSPYYVDLLDWRNVEHGKESNFYFELKKNEHVCYEQLKERKIDFNANTSVAERMEIIKKLFNPLDIHALGLRHISVKEMSSHVENILYVSEVLKKANQNYLSFLLFLLDHIIDNKNIENKNGYFFSCLDKIRERSLKKKEYYKTFNDSMQSVITKITNW